MEKEKILQLAEAFGFAQSALIKTQELVFVEEYRQYCEQNLCGNYNRNYGCPPYCGTVSEMREKVMQYENALVLKTHYEVLDALDGALIKPLKKVHTVLTRQLLEVLHKEGIERGLAIMAGPCNLCEECMMPKGIACLHENERFSCMSAYSIDVVELSKRCDMELSWATDQVSLFSIFAF